MPKPTTQIDNGINRTLCVAPMMGKTDRHFRTMLRIAAPNALLFTEMVASNSVVFSGNDNHLDFEPAERPLVLQLGGNDPKTLSLLSMSAEHKGFNEINLNVGCPSSKVKQGQFGACLMLKPKVVAQCIKEMKQAVSIPVTVKCRLGVDDQDSDILLHRFVEGLMLSGCDAIYLHARKAMLNGLTPAQNRNIPPIQQDRVYLLKKEFPDLEIIFNGEINTANIALEHLRITDGVMVGRAACNSPRFMSLLNSLLFQTSILKDEDIAKRYLDYMADQQRKGVPIQHMAKHMLSLFKGYRGARQYRRTLSDRSILAEITIDFIQRMVADMRPAIG